MDINDGVVSVSLERHGQYSNIWVPASTDMGAWLGQTYLQWARCLVLAQRDINSLARLLHAITYYVALHTHLRVATATLL